jgi:hypothetical protein
MTNSDSGSLANQHIKVYQFVLWILTFNCFWFRLKITMVSIDYYHRRIIQHGDGNKENEILINYFNFNLFKLFGSISSSYYDANG